MMRMSLDAVVLGVMKTGEVPRRFLSLALDPPGDQRVGWAMQRCPLLMPLSMPSLDASLDALS